MEAYTAAVEAGWCSPRTTIPLTDPEAIARKMITKLGTDQAQEVCSALARLVQQPPGETP